MIKNCDGWIYTFICPTHGPVDIKFDTRVAEGIQSPCPVPECGQIVGSNSLKEAILKDETKGYVFYIDPLNVEV